MNQRHKFVVFSGSFEMAKTKQVAHNTIGVDKSALGKNLATKAARKSAEIGHRHVSSIADDKRIARWVVLEF